MAKVHSKLTQETLKEVLEYNPETGVFTWRVTMNNNGARKGDVSDYRSDQGYIKIKLFGRLRRAHHLAWLYVYGEMPEYIDHKDGNPLNNAIGNLRKSTHQQNLRNQKKRANCKSQYKGVRFDKRMKVKKWYAHITVNYKMRSLGSFLTEEEAARRYDQEAKLLFGEFARLNFKDEL